MEKQIKIYIMVLIIFINSAFCKEVDVLETGYSVTSIGLGNITSVLLQDISGIQCNPAGFEYFDSKLGFSFLFSNWFFDSKSIFFSSTFKISSKFNIRVGVLSQSIPEEVLEIDEDGNKIYNLLKFENYILVFSGAKRFFGFPTGINVKIMKHYIGDTSFYSFYIDAGVLKELRIIKTYPVLAGIVLSDMRIIKGVKKNSLDTPAIKTGISFNIIENLLRNFGEVSYNTSLTFSEGVRFYINKFLSIYTGYNYQSKNVQWYSLATDIKFNYGANLVSFNYGFKTNKYFGFLSRIGLEIKF